MSELSEVDNYHRTRTRPGQIRRTEHLRKSHSGHFCDSSGRKKSVHVHSIADRLVAHSAIGPRMEHMRTPCQTWNGASDAKGRPRIWFQGRNLLATRLCLARAEGTQVAVQFCRNRACIRPDHIVLCDLRSAQRLHGRGHGRLGPGDLIMFTTMVRRRELSTRTLARATGLREAILSRIVRQCVQLRKRRCDSRQPGPNFRLTAS